MTSLDIRNNSAVMKRAEQLKRWEESDTNQQPPVPRPDRGSRIKFSSGCIFLAACLAGDKEEVLKLLEQGADINTANVDGLTALHQACIDDNLEMVEFLVEQGADINRQDNEGWTPLHATASCGFVSIARYLVEHGADVAAVNSDGDLAVDLAVDIQHLPMIDFMQKMVAEQQIDCAKARQAEQQQMLADAKKWLRSDASEIDRPHPKTGATALHVAAAKGYTKVLSLLLAGRANVDAQDNDGWTPLHAAAHWGQKEAAQMLLDAMADMDAHNYAGQTCIDVADRKMVKYLEEYRANNKRIKRRPSSQISRISDTIENHMDKTPPKIIRVEVRPDNNKDHPNDDKTSVQKTIEPATDDEAPWRRNNVARVRTSNDSPSKNLPDVIDVNKTTTATSNSTTTETTDVILRRTQSFENDEKFYQKYNELRARIKANSCPIIPATLQQQQQLHQQQQQQQQQEQLQQNNNVNNNNINNNLNNNSNNINRNSSSSSRPNNINNSSSSSSNNTPHTQFSTTTTKSLLSPTTFSLSSSSLPASTTTANTFAAAATTTQHHNISPSSATAATTTPTIATTAAPANQYTSPLYSSSSSNIISSPLYTVQRSASLKDHKQIFIRKSPPVSPAVSTTPAYTTTTNTTASPAAVATPIRSTTQTQQAKVVQNSSPNKDKNTNQTTSTTTNTNTINNNNSKTSPESKQAIQNNNNNNTTTTTNNNGSTATEAVKPKQSTGNMIKNFFKSFVPPVRDEESETQRKAHAKRVRETRRSTQGVTLDEIKSAEELVKKKNSSMNNNNNNSSSELDPEKQDSANDNEDKDKEKESGSENRGSRSRAGSTVSVATSTSSATDDKKTRDKTENSSGDNIDYKALWEAVKLENEKLRAQLKKKDEEVIQTRATLERFANATNKNSLSEIEKRERRAMERKLSELEEELKLLQKLKNENERLRAENRALTRVVSKLTSSAQSQLSKANNKQ
ncbi:myosin binding subunit isoform X27 [Musca autumnalis]|uniref:myosin binding subunit isoform X27 n=1 Tax=Musca autumnalis TaxID=221902 RepID=UPI003CF36866